MVICNMLKVSKIVTLAVLITVTALVSGCATSPKVQVVQAGDNVLSKDQLLAEINKLNEADQKINDKKGINGTNAAAALFFWPGLIYTQMDASDARKLVEQRRNHLTGLYNQKLAHEEGKTPQSRS